MLTSIRSIQNVLFIFAVALFGSCAANMALAQSVPILVQAESMALIAPMTVGNENAAIGGRFISPTSGTSTESPVQSASVQVNVPAGTYYLWARISGATDLSDALYVGIDASFDRIFPSATGVYEWVRVETSNGSGAFGFSLGAGSHTLQVGYGEIGAKLDAVYLTANAAEVPTFAPLHLLVEAESMNRTAPMTVGTDADASGGQYISPTSGTSSTSPVRNADALVNVPIAGTYYLWARIKGLTDTSDALYLGIDASFDRVFPATTGTYQWIRVENADASGAFGFSLGGAHIIQVGFGEIGARLDAVYLTDDANEVPPPGTTTPPPGPCANPSGGYEGFGRNTTGGAGQPIYRVTNLNDSGVGSLRDALRQGNRCIVFDVAGTISLGSTLFVTGNNITIDGFTAPSPGITLQNRTLVMEGPLTTGNVVVRGIRSRFSTDDGMRVFGRAIGASHAPVSNVVFDHVSVTGASDGAIDVTREANNVTIQWSILGPGSFRELSLLSLGAFRVTAHHNLYAEGIARQPGCDAPENGIAPSAGPVCDARNNLIWNYHQAGTEVRFSGATANVINNYYKAGTNAQSDQTIWLTNGGVAYTNGNFQNDFPNVNVNAFGNRSTPFPVDAADIPAFTDARTAAQAVKGSAGARGPNFGLDATDQAFINSISIP